MGQVRCWPTSPLLLVWPKRAMSQPSRRRGARGFLTGRQRPPPPSSRAQSPGLWGPRRHLPRVQAREQAEEEQQLRGHGAVELGERRPGPPAGRGVSRSTGLASSRSPLSPCLPCHGLRRHTDSRQPRSDRCGLRLPAAPPTAGGSARDSAGRTRDTRPPRRAAPRPRSGARSAQPGGWSWWARAVPGPAAPRPAEALPPPPRAERQCPGGGLCARCEAAARSEVGAARRPFLWQRRRGGPGGEEFPQLHA